eukprot:5408824-Ditylum_brightwellii.AAC.1
MRTTMVEPGMAIGHMQPKTPSITNLKHISTIGKTPQHQPKMKYMEKMLFAENTDDTMFTTETYS